MPRFPFLLSLYHSGDAGFDFRTEDDGLEFRTDDDLAALGEMAETLIQLREGERVPIAESDDYLRALVPFKRGAAVTECRAGRDWFEVDCDGSIKACHDGLPSPINALDEPDYDTMRREVARHVPEGCRCIYDFYFNAQHLEKSPFRYLLHVWRTRNLLSW